ncbi:uracil-xanthine transport protein [Companilactobacillus paralimentarius DSM 13238 = JCM 10415]|jgi:Xanthine/uracil permeases|uniref:Uracil-xanthine transport protein n=1 Tax=Companilactobacillus paralimentarius DSM 13238 = JCM 10415 TaxID=1122151 RepID=A0A0R1PKA0_9LACO|nr:solute carrier family 23 protein [Companilactobacillus paralimentarius]KAE9565360.1 xanthine/uracil permease [Companilactobacillus paralimentarius]KRL29144.1 uracil-xanthine transport protein [Companilactobacillus paralimentarius DSM 13238 = JCM 10415]MDR4933821.1 solute carrier family 23 protein [Companilactobacillus paralimentarius]QFR70256.1 purine permease [Companilactobacillus paralimentarius]
MENNKSNLLVGPDDKIGLGEAGFLGLQHVLAMDIYVPPIVLAGMMAMGLGDQMGLLQSTFLAAGIGTILQTFFFMKMPVSQGPSFVPLGAAAGVVLASGGLKGNGMGTLIGALLIGSIILIILGATGVFQKIINKLVPAMVGGTIITCVGLSLIPTALNSNIFNAPGNIDKNIILASITALTLVISVGISLKFPKVRRFFRTSSIILALGVGTLVSSMMGMFDWKTVADAAWFGLPQRTIFHWGINFSPSAIITFIIIYAVITTETTGTWFAMGAVTNHKITDKQWNHGIIGEGLSCLVAALLGTTPVTGYSTNAGVISITGVASKRVFLFAGIWFSILGFFSKLSAFLAAIPAPVIGGVFAIITVTIMLNGLNVIRGLETTDRDLYIIGLPIVLTLALVLLPANVTKNAPQILQYLLGSPIAVAAIAAIILNLVMPKSRKTSKVETVA